MREGVVQRRRHQGVQGGPWCINALKHMCFTVGSLPSERRAQARRERVSPFDSPAHKKLAAPRECPRGALSDPGEHPGILAEQK